ncbi:hypothetical protein [Lentilactobacillus kosonis]|uniref:DUF2628 domain-containing protein n=1 Tax=Lentilactobacillus kosonis TaxID=2810561 RepID=A0A401FPW3_9LACO|nr:hypothetical protein [Lentilactobacillus kosonis]GAY74318.1 hypothetical protein NBRC111893_2464 [Lentilactobacillus kosonis]
MKILVQHPLTKKIKTVPFGYSWTFLLFNWFVPLFRKDWLTAFGLLLANLAVTYLSGADGNFGLVAMYAVYAGFYNKDYAKRLLKRGYQPVDEVSQKVLEQFELGGNK